MRRRRSKALIAEVGSTYAEKLKRKFPGIEPEIIIPGIDGSDIWIRVEYPQDLAYQEDAIKDETAELYFQFYDEYGVTAVATVVPKMQEVEAGG